MLKRLLCVISVLIILPVCAGVFEDAIVKSDNVFLYLYMKNCDYCVKFNPNYDKDWGLYTDVNPNQIENILLKHSDIKAVFVTSPTYEGIFSNIKEISIICKKHNAVLVVDEAHGALLNFGNFKEQQAINCGADISIQSLHKTAGAPNPTALLHIGPCSNITQQTVQKALNTINTTSPSYPLLASIEACVKYLNSDKGEKHVNKIIENADYFATSLDNSYEIFSKNNDKKKIGCQI